MVRHTKIEKTTKMAIGDEVLYQGSWKKVTSITKEYIAIELQTFLTLNDLITKWEIEVFKDFSNSSSPEYSINLVNSAKASTGKKIVLFNETGVAATRNNIEKLTSIANIVKDYMNKEGIDFEEEKPCRQ